MIHFSNFLQAISSFIFNPLSFINFILQFLVSLESKRMCFPSSSSRHMGHLLLFAFFLTPFNCHTPANNHAIPLLSFLEHHSMYNFLPHKKLNSLYIFKELFSGNFANKFCLSVSLHLSFNIVIIKIKSHLKYTNSLKASARSILNS